MSERQWHPLKSGFGDDLYFVQHLLGRLLVNGWKAGLLYHALEECKEPFAKNLISANERPHITAIPSLSDGFSDLFGRKKR